VEGKHIKTSLYHNYCITTLFHETMSAKYVWSANGTRVLSEDYQETQSSSPEQVNQVKAALIELLLKQPNGTKILSPQDKQVLLKKATQGHGQTRCKS